MQHQKIIRVINDSTELHEALRTDIVVDELDEALKLIEGSVPTEIVIYNYQTLVDNVIFPPRSIVNISAAGDPVRINFKGQPDDPFHSCKMCIDCGSEVNFMNLVLTNKESRIFIDEYHSICTFQDCVVEPEVVVLNRGLMRAYQTKFASNNCIEANTCSSVDMYKCRLEFSQCGLSVVSNAQAYLDNCASKAYADGKAEHISVGAFGHVKCAYHTFTHGDNSTFYTVRDGKLELLGCNEVLPKNTIKVIS
jgi:hypothetical protein